MWRKVDTARVESANQNRNKAYKQNKLQLPITPVSSIIRKAYSIIDTGFPLINCHFAISNDAVNGRGYGAGARPGLQIRCFPALVGKGEFDSHALPPFF